jgi:hypothetical protein
MNAFPVHAITAEKWMWQTGESWVPQETRQPKSRKRNKTKRAEFQN